MNYRVKNHRGKISNSKKLWFEPGDSELFLKRLRVDAYQHPLTGKPITSKQRTEFLEYYRTILNE